MAVLDHLKALLLVVDGLSHYRHLGIELAKEKEIRGEFGGDGESNILKIGSRGLIGLVGGFYAVTHTTEQVDFIVQIKGNLKNALRDWRRSSCASHRRTIARKALTLRGWIRTHLWVQAGGSDSRKCPGLSEPRDRGFQGLIAREGTLLKLVEFRIRK